MLDRVKTVSREYRALHQLEQCKYVLRNAEFDWDFNPQEIRDIYSYYILVETIASYSTTTC